MNINYNNTIKLHKYIEKMILSLLPPKDLYGLRVVCKRWNSMLTTICNEKYKVLMDAGQFISSCSEFEQKILIHSIFLNHTRHISFIDLKRGFEKAFFVSNGKLKQKVNNIINKWQKDNCHLPKDRYILHVRTEFNSPSSKCKYQAYIHITDLKYNSALLEATKFNTFYHNIKLKENTTDYLSYGELEIIDRQEFIRNGSDDEEREDRRVMCEVCDNFFLECEIFKLLEYECNYPK